MGSTTIDPENSSFAWARAFVGALAANGLREVCISPGSRSTPLTLAFFAHPAIQVYQQLDERSGGFFALGLALALNRPVALLCTSGTAAANYYPAIIEARMSGVPLLVLTADRPPELRHSGANQTIDQVKMFGDQVLWAVDMALPETDAAPQAWRNLRQIAARALATADGLRKGPVHLNFPFRKPLEAARPATWQAEDPGPDEPSAVRIEDGLLLPTAAQAHTLARLMSENPRGLIVAGPQHASHDLVQRMQRLAQVSGYPILADSLSGLRFAPRYHEDALVCRAYDNYLGSALTDDLKPDLILRFGSMPVSKRLNDFLDAAPDALHIHARASGVWADERHRVDHFLRVDPGQLCRIVADQYPGTPDRSWQVIWQEMEQHTSRLLAATLPKRPFDGAFVAALLAALPTRARVFAGNSLPIRHVDQFGFTGSEELTVFANRGASGIDGNISTGMGIAAAHEGPVVILVGDVTFYHDNNGLRAARSLGLHNVTIVLLNNNGGGIFRRLPIVEFEPPFTELFQTPPELDFSAFAAAYDLVYARTSTLDDFAAALRTAVTSPGPTLIEVPTAPDSDLQARLEVEAALRESLRRGKSQAGT